MKILCIGHAAYDITIPVLEFPKENTKMRVEKKLECGGGPASNAAYLLAKWGMETYFMGVVGNDLYGANIKKELDDIGVNTKYLELNNNVETTSSYIIANTNKGSRTIITCRNSKIQMYDVSIDFEPDVILLDGQEYEMSKKLLNKYKNAISIIDASRPTKEIIELSKMTNYVVCSHEFAEELSGLSIDVYNKNNLKEVYLKLIEELNTNVVVTLEAHGSLYSYNNEIKLMPSLKVKAVDSTGAGDIYHGAFTYGIANNLNYEEIIKMSNIAGALSVIKIGGRNSVPETSLMKEYYENFR